MYISLKKRYLSFRMSCNWFRLKIWQWDRNKKEKSKIYMRFCIKNRGKYSESQKCFKKKRKIYTNCKKICKTSYFSMTHNLPTNAIYANRRSMKAKWKYSKLTKTLWSWIFKKVSFHHKSIDLKDSFWRISTN